MGFHYGNLKTCEIMHPMLICILWLLDLLDLGLSIQEYSVVQSKCIFRCIECTKCLSTSTIDFDFPLAIFK